MRIAPSLSLCLGIGAAALAGCRPASHAPEPAPLVAVGPVERYAGEASAARYSASIAPYSQVDVAFKVGGYVTEIAQVRGADRRPRSIQGGDRVKQGDLLARVRQADFTSSVGQSRAQLGQAQASVGQVEAQSAQSRAQVAQAQSAIAEAEAGRQATQSQLAQAQAQEAQARSGMAEAEAGRDGARSQVTSAEVAKKQAQAQLSQALAGREQARSQLAARVASREEARLAFERATRLFRSQSLTKPDLDSATANYDVARAQVDAAQGQLDEADGKIVAAREQVDAAQAQIDGARAQLAGSQGKLDGVRAQLAAAQAAVKGARAQIDASQAKIEGARSQLAAAQAGARGVRAQQESARAAVGGARATLAGAKLPLQDATLRSPMDGLVLKRQIEIGTLVAPGTAGFTVADVRQVKVVYGVPDVVVGQLRLGSPQTITVEAVPGTRFRGRITAISPSADPKNRVFQVEVTVPNPRRQLEVGMIASLELAGARLAQPMDVVPVSAVVRPPGGEEGYAVYVVEQEGGKLVARLRRVQLGPAFGNRVAVLGGVRLGERVITSGAGLLRDGQEVRIAP
jgi:multidrug efflux system membrane fusion protein